MRSTARFGALLLFLAGVEGMARLDDTIHLGVPFLASPDNEYDLKLRESWGFRGRPHGLFRKWKLNEYGFRGPEIAERPAADVNRVFVLGASETFGLLESNQREYPAQLQEILQQRGNFEVVNGGITSMTAASMLSFWENWACRFQPRIVVIYASPVFYLRDLAPEPPRVLPESELASAHPEFQLRLVDRASSLYRQLPFWVRSIRRDWQLKREVASHEKSWFFTTVPEDRLAQYRDDVATLVRRIRESGACPIIVTHAISATFPPRTEDLPHLHDMRAEFSRPTAEIMSQFEKRANQALRELGRQEGIPLVDVDAALTGQRGLFGDLVHFNDAGSARMAELLADGIATQSAQTPSQAVSKSTAQPLGTAGPARSVPRFPGL
ncbi:MAG: SGNH/GDSL hydrolase family protein [Planctomycetia bacterium]|nr:SGNH/GDSL hydrolase family protein [Planctomycetia bacterium]